MNRRMPKNKTLLFQYLFLLLFLCLGITACLPTNTLALRTIYGNDQYYHLYKDKLEEGATLVYADKYSCIEQTKDGLYVYKYYSREGKRELLSYDTYTTKRLTRKTGASKSWTLTGFLLEEGNYQNNLREGTWNYYHHGSSTLMRKCTYQEGQLNGQEFNYFENGDLSSEYTYVDGKKNGVFVSYNEDGSIKEQGEYQDDVFVGVRKVEEILSDTIITVVENMPYLISCENEPTPEDIKKCTDKTFLTEIYQNLFYPPLARENGIEGMNVIQYTIDEKGRIRNPTMIRHIGSGCDQATLWALKRLCEMEPLYKPGLQRGKPVKVLFKLPLKFRLV